MSNGSIGEAMSSKVARERDGVVTVDDPFQATADPRMPCLTEALNPSVVQRYFRSHLADFIGAGGRLHVRAIRVVRHKPGRRCLIEYDVQLMRRNEPPEAGTLIGKARAKGLDQTSFERLVALSHNGFADGVEDGVSVPEPIGCVPPLRMWLQRKVPGTIATPLLPACGGVELARHIAYAAHKLHRSNVPFVRRHTMIDELRILSERLREVSQMKPAWNARLLRVMSGCERLGAAIPMATPCGIHRDFYPDQVIVDGTRVYLLDLDLYCEGDPALDIGNFLGHLTEQALRTLGDPDALSEQEAALQERFLKLSSATTRRSVRAFKTLTLARHIFISTQFIERRDFTAQLLDLCEQRLSQALASHAFTETISLPLGQGLSGGRTSQ